MNYENYKRDCHWLEESNDMSAILHFCRWQEKHGRSWPFDKCPEDCEKYITKEEANAIIIHHLNHGYK